MNVPLVGISPNALKACRPHSHASWEIVLNFEGEGTTLIDGTEYPFREGTIICQPPYSLHSKSSGESFNDIFIHVDDIEMPGGNVVTIFQDDEEKSCETLLFLALRIFHKKEPNHVAVINSICETIYQLLLSWSEGKERNESIELFKNILIENFTNPEFKLSEAMEKIPYCGDHFRRQFKKDVGMTPLAYLTNLRIEYAKKLLCRMGVNQMNIGEISLSSGFCDQHYFSRVFKKKTKLTPQEYAGFAAEQPGKSFTEET